VTATANSSSARALAEIVTVAALGHAGDGIAETAEGRVFVPLTLPGEEVEIERDGDRGRLLRVLKPNPDRVAPVCRHFGVCGTCAVEHMERGAYLAWKRGLVAAAFAQRRIAADVEPVVPIELGSRRRAIFSAVRTARGVVLGFHRRGGQEIVAIEECPVLAPGIVEKLPILRDIVGMALKPGRPGRVVVLLADNGLDVAVDGVGRLSPAGIAMLGRFAGDASIARLTVDDNVVFQNRRPELAADDAALFPTPGGFVQAAAAAEAALATAVLAFVGDAAPVADLFAGIGTFTLRIAARAPVTAVEGDVSLLAALDLAARRARGVRPVTARKRDLFRNPLAPTELKPFGAVVFDPPAAGAKAQAEALAASTVPKVAAVSCNPATLARDARILIDGGYVLTGLLPVDQFLFSAEIEAVASFVRRE
jgi:23S rRNA (uracil1939-C5)-methyltransferase